MYTNSKYEEFLKKNICDKGCDYTHTKIGSRDLGIYGNIYNIKNMSEFYSKYYEHVFVNGNKEYMTEKQLIENGPLLIDIDMRYESTIKQRRHTKEHIIDLINIIAYKLSNIYKINDDDSIPVYVMEKDNVNILDSKTKDGIHLIIGIKCHKAIQMIIRDNILDEVKESWDDLPLTNNTEDLIDEGIIKGTVNWQLYGSRKPGCEAYKLSYYYLLSYNNNNDEWMIEKVGLNKLDIKDNLYKLSARYDKHLELELNKSYEKKFEEYKDKLLSKNKKIRVKSSDNIDLDCYDYSKISSHEVLDNLLDKLFEDLSPCDYELKEIHDFTMALSDKYYGANSYNNWIRVGWALKNKSKKLFLTWLKMSTKSSEFNWYEVEKFYNLWKTFDESNPDGLTERSIMYWLRNENMSEYNKIRRETISYYVEQTIDKSTDFDLATVLYQLYKDRFVCVSIKNNIWYEYKNNRWYENDSGNTLRLKISTEMYNLYMSKSQALIELLNKIDNSNENHEKLLIKCNKV